MRKAFGGLAVIATLGTLAYTIVALFMSPEGFPAHDIIALQASWNDGRYYVKFTFLVTWITLIALAGVAALPIAIVGRLAGASRAEPPGAPRQTLPPLGIEWHVIVSRSRWTSLVGTIAGLGLGAPVMLALMFTPESLQPAGFVGSLVLLLGPVLLLVGEFFGVELILGTSVVYAMVDDLAVEQRGRYTHHWLHAAGRKFEVPADAFSKLARGAQIALRHAGGTHRLIELRMYAGGYR